MIFQRGIAIERWDRFRWLLALSISLATLSLALLVPGAIDFYGYYDFYFYSGIIALLFAVGIFIMWFACQMEVSDECVRFLDEVEPQELKKKLLRPSDQPAPEDFTKESKNISRGTSRSSVDQSVNFLKEVTSISSDCESSGSDTIFFERSTTLPSVECDEITEDSLDVIDERSHRMSRVCLTKKSAVYPDVNYLGTSETRQEPESCMRSTHSTNAAELFSATTSQVASDIPQNTGFTVPRLIPLKKGRENPAFVTTSQSPRGRLSRPHRLPPIEQRAVGE